MNACTELIRYSIFHINIYKRHEKHLLSEKKRILNHTAQKKKDEMMDVFQKIMKKNGGKLDVTSII